MLSTTRHGRWALALAVLLMVLHPWLWLLPIGLSLIDGAMGLTESWMARDAVGARVRADRARLMATCVRTLRPAVLVGLLLIMFTARVIITYAAPDITRSAPLPVASEGAMATVAVMGFPRYEMDRFEHPNTAGEPPTTGRSLKEARAICRAQDKRLCSSEEFFHACAEGGAHPFLLETNDDVRTHCHVGALLGHEAGEMAVTGSHPGCRTTTGIYDLTGNAFEWVEDDRGDGFGTLAGSFYGYADDVTMDCGFRVLLHPTQLDHVDRSAVGFRCCR